MTAIDISYGEVSYRSSRAAQNSLLWLLPWGAALAFGAGLGTWESHLRRAAEPEIVAAPIAHGPALAPETNPYGGLVGFARDVGSDPANRDAVLEARLEAAAALSAPQLASASAPKNANPYGGLIDPGFVVQAKPSGAPPIVASLEAAPASPAVMALPPKREVAALEQAPPLPPARPAEPSLPARRAAQPSDRTAVAPPPTDDRNVFEKLFGIGRRPAAVAYAEPEAQAAAPPRGASLAAVDRSSGFSVFAKSAPPAGYDKFTAVYDISARVVYLPDGTRLEAHSGYGERLDDPRFVSERNRGATPPHLYDLTLREELFHGVQALRLTPIGDGDVFGRAGLLAHPFMLGPDGDSNGCVSFRDYDAFLRAYQQGLVKRLAVVAKL